MGVGIFVLVAMLAYLLNLITEGKGVIFCQEYGAHLAGLLCALAKTCDRCVLPSHREANRAGEELLLVQPGGIYHQALIDAGMPTLAARV